MSNQIVYESHEIYRSDVQIHLRPILKNGCILFSARTNTRAGIARVLAVVLGRVISLLNSELVARPVEAAGLAHVPVFVFRMYLYPIRNLSRYISCGMRIAATCRGLNRQLC